MLRNPARTPSAKTLPAIPLSLPLEIFVYLEMASLEIDILNPKANKLLQALADLKLIAIKKANKNDPFLKSVRKIRAKAGSDAPSFEDITREVDLVRAKRYAKSRR